MPKLILQGEKGMTRDFYVGGKLFAFRAGVPTSVPDGVSTLLTDLAPTLFTEHKEAEKTEKKTLEIEVAPGVEVAADFLDRFKQGTLLEA